MGIKIGIISDTHLGAFLLEPELNRDAFESFEEALKILVANGADIIIHSGDFYDRIDPQPWVQDKATNILRSTITGDNPDLKVIEGKVNFQAEDVKIAVPLFLIHGTHDRPIGRPMPAPPFQHLIAAGYANYIDIDPNNQFAFRQIVLQKDDIKISITGVGHRPEGYINKSLTEYGIPYRDDAINISCVHNAIEGIVPTSGEYLDLTLFSSIDYVIVGHAHQPRLDSNGVLELCKLNSSRTKLLVPGATIATGLYPQEQGIKYAHLLEIPSQERPPKIKSFRLKNARQIFYHTIRVENLTAQEVRDEIERFLENLPIEKLEKKPLIRVNLIGKLKLGLSKRELKLDEIASRYKDKVYNWQDMLLPIDLYSEEELKHLNELKGAIEIGATLPTTLDHFCRKLQILNFPAKYFKPEEIYHMLHDVKVPVARKRIEIKLNEVLGIEHN
jgi:double-strand break repair protein MRE11